MTNDPLWPLLLLLRYMHIFGAITLMGATIFLRFALLPAVSKLDPKVKSDLHEDVRTRWSKFVMAATALLLISGITNLALASRYNYPDLPKDSIYHMIVGVKFLLALPIFFIAAILAGRTALAKKFQANAKMWMNVNLALAVLMVLIGGGLRYVPRSLKKPAENQPAAAAGQIGPNSFQKLPLDVVAK